MLLYNCTSVNAVLFADIDAREWGSLRTALHNAAEQGHKEIVELLLVRGAKTEIRDALNATPLHSAARTGNKEIVELLIAKGANVNAKDGGDQTPLWYAQDEGYAEIVELLLKHGAKE